MPSMYQINLMINEREIPLDSDICHIIEDTYIKEFANTHT